MALRVFVSYAQEDGHNEVVREFWAFLRHNGVDARLDKVAAGQRQDWALWMADQIREADVVLCVASQLYKERAEGRSRPDVGKGVQWEARLIRDAFHADQDNLQKFVPVVLPGQTRAGVPDFLGPSTTTVYEVRDFTFPGAETLLRFLYKKPEVVEPPLGIPPAFTQWTPPRFDSTAAPVVDPAPVIDPVPTQLVGTIAADLRAMRDDDPIPVHELSHLYLLAQPETASRECLVDFLARRDVHEVVNKILADIRTARGGATFDPDLRDLPYRSQRAEGVAFTKINPRYRNECYEPGAIDLIVQEDGGLRLTCGRGVQPFRPERFMHEREVPVVIASLIRGLSYSFAAFAGALGDRYAAYQGRWQLGLRLCGLQGAYCFETLQRPIIPATEYTRDVFERITHAATEDLVNAPAAVADRLSGALLRGMDAPIQQ